MVDTCLQNNANMTQAKLITTLKATVQNYSLLFSPGDTYYWSPKERTIYYQSSDRSEIGLWTLLHETCHGLRDHTTYQSDFELITLEVAAWQKAQALGKELSIQIDEDHIQDCLDSYRDWQYKRSLCPDCALGGIQTSDKTYTCLFCDNDWHVSTARFCRPYRRKKT